MNRLISLHPTFDALSAYSDRHDLGAPRSRVGRHVETCAECQATLEEIRALGAAAREMAVGEAPADLWERIVRGASPSPLSATVQVSRPALADVAARPAPALPARRPLEGPSARAWVGVMVAVAAALAALVAWPGGRSLQAVGVSRLTFSPSRPVPGGVLTVRYRPAGAMKGAARLVLVGKWLDSRPADRYRFLTLMDSLASLHLAADGLYEARLRLPNDFLGASLAVSDGAGRSDLDGHRAWQVVGGEPNGRPSLASLLASIGSSRHVSGLDPAFQPRQSFDPADSLKRYFPEHPAGWAYASNTAGRGSLVERLISYFRSSEKKYLALSATLWPRTGLDAERMHDMAELAFAIEEPGEASRWIMRLVREHPEDPRALGDLLTALHAVELREPPALADSIRPWLPMLDSLYAHSGQPDEDANAAWILAGRYADSPTIALWEGRAAREGRFQFWDSRFDRDEPARRELAADWSRATSSRCEVPPGKFSIGGVGEDWVSACQRQQVFAFAFRARSALLDRDAAMARRLADSAITSSLAWQSCASFYGAYLTRARAALTLGDSAGARRDLVTYGSFAISAVAARDSARRWLGPRFDEAQFTTATDSVATVFKSCLVKKRAEALRRREERLQAAR